MAIERKITVNLPRQPCVRQLTDAILLYSSATMCSSADRGHFFYPLQCLYTVYEQLYNVKLI
jgi:hypothetical protein